MDEVLNMNLSDMNKEELVKIIMENPFNNLLKHLTDDIPVCVVNRKAELPKEIKKAIETIKPKKLVPDGKARKYTLTEEQFNKPSLLQKVSKAVKKVAPVVKKAAATAKQKKAAKKVAEALTKRSILRGVGQFPDMC